MSNPKAEVYPVMLTPFTAGNSVDYGSLSRLIRWYEDGGASGLFAVCFSSEMFQLSLEERVTIARFVKEHSRVPVVASGHLGGEPARQLDDLRCIAATGVDATVLISSALASQDQDDRTLIANLEWLLARLDPSTPLGIYECPLPYKRILSDEVFRFILETDRFTFLKDTCCDLGRIRSRLRLAGGTGFRLFNAHAETLVASLEAGAAGYSGVHANCSIELLSRICAQWKSPGLNPADHDLLMRIAAFCPNHLYPVCAKEMLRLRGVIQSIHTRFCDTRLFDHQHQAATRKLLEATHFHDGRSLQVGRRCCAPGRQLRGRDPQAPP